jgi:hypothetical protein
VEFEQLLVMCFNIVPEGPPEALLEIAAHHMKAGLSYLLTVVQEV